MDEMEERDRIIALISSYQIFTTPEGRVVLEDLANACFHGQSTFHADTHTMAFQEGMRFVFLRILKAVNNPKEAIEEMANGCGDGANNDTNRQSDY